MLAKDMTVTLSGGAFGGLLAPIAQAITRAKGDLLIFAIPDLPLYYWALFSMLGSIMAWVSVFLANSKRDDLRHLSAFAIICGLTFPSLVLSTLNDNAQEAVGIVETAAASAQGDNDQPEIAVAAVAETISTIPASTVGREGTALIEANAQSLINNISQSDTIEAFEQAKLISDAANEAGYQRIRIPNGAFPSVSDNAMNERDIGVSADD